MPQPRIYHLFHRGLPQADWHGPSMANLEHIEEEPKGKMAEASEPRAGGARMSE